MSGQLTNNSLSLQDSLDAFTSAVGEKVAESNTEPGNQGGSSTHESAKTDDDTAACNAGSHYNESQQCTSDAVPQSVNTSSPGKGDTIDSQQPNRGPSQYGTGENPAVEGQSGDRPEDPGTTHPANMSVGEKYSSFDDVIDALRKSAAAITAEIGNAQAVPVTADRVAVDAQLAKSAAEQALQVEQHQANMAASLKQASLVGVQLADLLVESATAEAKLAATKRAECSEDDDESPKKPDPSSETSDYGDSVTADSDEDGDSSTESGSNESGSAAGDGGHTSEGAPPSESAMEVPELPADLPTEPLPHVEEGPPVGDGAGVDPNLLEMMMGGGDASSPEGADPAGPIPMSPSEIPDMGGIEGVPEGVDPEELAVLESLLAQEGITPEELVAMLGEGGGAPPMEDPALAGAALPVEDPSLAAGPIMAREPKMADWGVKVLEKVSSFRRANNRLPFKIETESHKRAFQEMKSVLTEYRTRRSV